MAFLLIGVALLCVFLLAGNAFVRANPASLVKQLRLSGGVLLLAAAVVLAVTGRWVLAVPIGGFALSLLGGRNLPGFSGVGRGGAKSGDQTSVVRSAYFEMRLDHGGGEMSGSVLKGRFEGKSLGALTPGDLNSLWREAHGDAQSLTLLEAYLDRRLPGWRVDFKADAANGQGGAASSGAMSKEEAYQVLGLPSGSGEAEIRAAHRRLMKGVHPDRGGSAFMAAKLNEAKDVLLRGH